MTLLLPSSATATALAAINSISATTAGSVNAPETDVEKGKQLHHDDIKQDQAAADLANSAPSSIIKKQSIVKETPDVGILSKDFLTNKGREQPVDKQFTIHRKKQAASVDVGILSNGRQQQQTPRANLHAMNEITTGRSLQSEEVLPYMCPDKNGFGASLYNFDNLFNKTDGYFPKCSCPSPTTCGPVLCECLELDADGDMLQCMDPLKQLCEGTKYIEGIQGPWSMEECLGSKKRTIKYCSFLPCFLDGGSWSQCQCKRFDSYCTVYKNTYYCARSKCCQAQTDDEGREACIYGGYENYFDQVTSFYISREEMASRFNECSFNSDSDKSIVECYCESFSYRLCVNYGVMYPDYCEAMHCCFEQTEDDARLDCFTTRFRNGFTGWEFYSNSYTIYESCIASGKSSDQCKCDIHGLSNCLGEGGRGPPGSQIVFLNKEPSCDLFQCCQSQTLDEGRKDCLVQDGAQLRYETCVNDGNTIESCYCDKSNTLCSSGHSNDLHCELSSCCQEQSDDIGRRECIGNFTTNQPSFAPSSDSIPQPDTSPASSPSTGDQVLEGSTVGTPNNSDSNLPGRSKKVHKALVVTVVMGWLLLT